MIRNIKLFAITTISTLLLGSVLNAQIIDAKQLFNKKLIKVQSEEISLSKSYYGITKIDESSQVDIVSRFDGYITKLNANKAYMNIRKGEALYSIYSEDILSIQSELELAKDFNKNIYNSTLMRLDNLGISISEQDKIKKNKLNSNGIMVTSPINGILLQRNINNLSAIKKGNTLLSLASLDKIWFIISVYQNDLAFIKKDMKAKINIDGQSNNINSTVDFIYPTFDEKTKTVDVRFIIDNKNQELIPSMFGKANIQVNKDRK
ncbi:MAG: efflux RND transporter periplasmic adaptor subunit, partial [Aliarcobacter sp.]|nr:efflux RND transporter periplasmic adaptor subunit [Aliarcobacter sp.]